MYRLNDHIQHQHNSKQPVYILEVGSGHGKFSFLVLQALLELAEFLPTIDVAHTGTAATATTAGTDGSDSSSNAKQPGFVYIISDISQKSLDFIAQHPNMQQVSEPLTLQKYASNTYV
jgi:hypothetical protein